MQPKDENVFITERLPLAAYLHASRKLRYRSCGHGLNPGKIRFAFDDPEGIGDQLEVEYDSGAVCSATALFAAQKFMRRKMDEAALKIKNRNLAYADDNR
jgi:hypothetical protein